MDYVCEIILIKKYLIFLKEFLNVLMKKHYFHGFKSSVMINFIYTN